MDEILNLGQSHCRSMADDQIRYLRGGIHCLQHTSNSGYLNRPLFSLSLAFNTITVRHIFMA